MILVGDTGRSYEIIDEIVGNGRNLRRVREQNDSQEIFMVKLLPISSLQDIENGKKEAELLKSLEHPYIVRYEDSFDVNLDNFTYIAIVMENSPGGNLMDHLQDRKERGDLPTPEWSQTVIGQLLEATAFCHSKGVVHRDIKPENIFLSEDMLTIKVGDFGISEEIMGTRTAVNAAGTDLYRPPESLRNRQHELSFRTDIWSIGIVIHQIVTLRHPFQGQDNFETMSNIVNGKRIPIEDVMEQLLEKCLQVDPSQRADNSSVLAEDEYIIHTCQQLRNYIKPSDIHFRVSETQTDKIIIKRLQELINTQKEDIEDIVELKKENTELKAKLRASIQREAESTRKRRYIY